jgi:hypothetical protein
VLGVRAACSGALNRNPRPDAFSNSPLPINEECIRVQPTPLLSGTIRRFSLGGDRVVEAVQRPIDDLKADMKRGNKPPIPTTYALRHSECASKPSHPTENLPRVSGHEPIWSARGCDLNGNLVSRSDHTTETGPLSGLRCYGLPIQWPCTSSRDSRDCIRGGPLLAALGRAMGRS